MQMYANLFKIKEKFYFSISWPILILFVLSDRAWGGPRNFYTEFWNSLIMQIYANLFKTKLTKMVRPIVTIYLEARSGPVFVNKPCAISVLLYLQAIGVRGGGGGGWAAAPTPPPPPGIFQITIFGQKKTMWYSGKTTWFSDKQWRKYSGNWPQPPYPKLFPYAYASGWESTFRFSMSCLLIKLLINRHVAFISHSALTLGYISEFITLLSILFRLCSDGLETYDLYSLLQGFIERNIPRVFHAVLLLHLWCLLLTSGIF